MENNSEAQKVLSSLLSTLSGTEAVRRDGQTKPEIGTYIPITRKPIEKDARKLPTYNPLNKNPIDGESIRLPSGKLPRLSLASSWTRGMHQTSVFPNSAVAAREMDTHAAALGVNSKCYTEKNGSNAGAFETRSLAFTKGDFSNAATLSEDSTSRTNGDFSHAFAASKRASAFTHGRISHAVSTGPNGTAVTHGVDSIAVCLGLDGAVAAFEDGALIACAYFNKVEHRIDLKIGRVGEGDLEAGYLYRVDARGKWEVIGQFKDKFVENVEIKDVIRSTYE